ncbi:hypothetical protein [Desulfurobacterium sp.]
MKTLKMNFKSSKNLLKFKKKTTTIFAAVANDLKFHKSNNKLYIEGKGIKDYFNYLKSLKVNTKALWKILS